MSYQGRKDTTISVTFTKDPIMSARQEAIFANASFTDQRNQGRRNHNVPNG